MKGLSLEVRAGEVLGIAGLMGMDNPNWFQALTGLRKVESGKVTLNGDDITNQRPRKITLEGVGHVPEDRHKYGLVLDMTLAENIALQTYFTDPLSKKRYFNYNEINEPCA